MKIVEILMKKVLDKAIIVEKKRLTNSIYKIKIKSENIKNMDFIAGSFLRLGVGVEESELSIKDKMRSYSIWNIDRNNNTLDLAIATHSNGIGTRWVEDCKLNQNIYFKIKKGKFIVDNTADSYLMIGDLSALSHLYVINRNLSKEKHVESIIYSQKINELFSDIDGTNPFDFYEMEENPLKEIKSKLHDLVSNMKGEKIVYLAGDSRICIALNNYFRKELNWKTKQVKTKPFWNPDKKGLE